MRSLVPIFLLFTIFETAHSQSITEPQYIGQVKMIFEDGTATTLGQEPCKDVLKTSLYVGSSGLYHASSSSNYTYLPDRQEFAVMSMDEDVRLLVRVPSMEYAPESMIEIYQIKNNLNGRYIGNRITYSAEQYGESSYIIELPCSIEGEVAVVVAGCGNMASTMRIEYNERFYSKKIQHIISYLQTHNIELRRPDARSEIFDINSGYYIAQKRFIDQYGIHLYYKLNNAYDAEMRRQKQEKHNMEEFQRLEQKRIMKEARKAAKKSQKQM